MEYIALNDICDVRDGTHDSPKYVQEGFPLVTSKNIVDGKLDLSTVNYITQVDYDKINERSKVDEGDIIMPMIGTIGNPLLIEDFCEFAIKNVALIKFSNKEICNKYIWYFLKSGAFKKYVDEKNKGGTQKFLSLGDIRGMKVPILEYSEQISVVEKFDAVYKVISERNEELQLLDNLIKARFVEMFGTPYGNEKGFPMLTVNDVIEFTGGAQPDKKYFEYEPTEDNIRLIQIRDYKTDNYITYIPKTMAKRFCDADDIMIGRYGPPIFQILKGIEGSYNVALMKAIPKMGNKEFIRYFLKQECLFNYLDGLSQRTAGQSGIEMSALKAYPFPYPPIELQEKFEQIAKEVDKSKVAIQKALTETQLLFDSLMQQYFG